MRRGRDNYLISRFTKYNIRYDRYSYLWFRYHKLFFGALIKKGEKIKAFYHFCEIKYMLKKHERIDPFWIFLIGMIKVTPSVILLPLKLGGEIHGIPVPINERKQYTYAVKWVIKCVRERYKKLSANLVSEVIIGSIYGKSIVLDKRSIVYKSGSFNRHLIRLIR